MDIWSCCSVVHRQESLEKRGKNMEDKKKRLPIDAQIYDAFKEECKLYNLKMSDTVERLIVLFLAIQGEKKWKEWR